MARTRNGRDARALRKSRADERAAARASEDFDDSPRAQIERLNHRLGNGEGAAAERARLAVA